MNNNDILNKYIDLIDKGYCCACNELNCIDNFPQTKITHAIKKLQQEMKKVTIQQKEFILYLRHLSNWYSADGVKQGMVNGILQKYKEIIGVSDDKTN